MSNEKTEYDQVFYIAIKTLGEIRNLTKLRKREAQYLDSIITNLDRWQRSGERPEGEFLVSASRQFSDTAGNQTLLDVECRFIDNELYLGSGGYQETPRGSDSFTNCLLTLNADDEINCRRRFDIDLDNFMLSWSRIKSAALSEANAGHPVIETQIQLFRPPGKARSRP